VTKSDQIDVKGDGRVVLYKREGLKNPVWQARLRIPNSTGYKIVSTKTDDLRAAERFALNLYEELYIHVRSGGSIKSKTFRCLSPLKLSHYCCAIGEGFGWLGSAIRMRIV